MISEDEEEDDEDEEEEEDEESLRRRRAMSACSLILKAVSIFSLIVMESLWADRMTAIHLCE